MKSFSIIIPHLVLFLSYTINLSESSPPKQISELLNDQLHDKTYMEASQPKDFDPYVPGPHSAANYSFDRTFIIGLPENVDVYLPTEPGSYPIVYFADGFNMAIPSSLYHEVVTGIAEHGFIVVVMWRVLGSIMPPDKLQLFYETLEWCSAHLEDKLHNSGVSGDVHIDFDNTLHMCHSAGCHLAFDYFKEGCGEFKALALLSPVDGVDPFGLYPIYTITPGELVNFDLPMYLLALGLESVPSQAGVSCAPEELGSKRFWNAIRPESNRWFVNATDYGHADFLDYRYLTGGTDGVCYISDSTEDEFRILRRFVIGQVVSFFKGVLDRSCDLYFPFLEDYENMPVQALGEYFNEQCPPFQCNWTPLPTTESPEQTMQTII